MRGPGWTDEHGCMPAKFKLMREWGGRFRFKFTAPNRETIAVSEETFATKEAARRGIAIIKKHAAQAAVEDETGV